MNGTQADGLPAYLAHIEPPPKEHDAEVFKNGGDIHGMIVAGKARAAMRSRIETIRDCINLIDECRTFVSGTRFNCAAEPLESAQDFLEEAIESIKQQQEIDADQARLDNIETTEDQNV